MLESPIPPVRHLHAADRGILISPCFANDDSFRKYCGFWNEFVRNPRYISLLIIAIGLEMRGGKQTDESDNSREPN